MTVNVQPLTKPCCPTMCNRANLLGYCDGYAYLPGAAVCGVTPPAAATWPASLSVTTESNLGVINGKTLTLTPDSGLGPHGYSGILALQTYCVEYICDYVTGIDGDGNPFSHPIHGRIRVTDTLYITVPCYLGTNDLLGHYAGAAVRRTCDWACAGIDQSPDYPAPSCDAPGVTVCFQIWSLTFLPPTDLTIDSCSPLVMTSGTLSLPATPFDQIGGSCTFCVAIDPNYYTYYDSATLKLHISE